MISLIAKSPQLPLNWAHIPVCPYMDTDYNLTKQMSLQSQKNTHAQRERLQKNSHNYHSGLVVDLCGCWQI